MARRDGSGWQQRLECGGRSGWQKRYDVKLQTHFYYRYTPTTECILLGSILCLFFTSNVLGEKAYVVSV